MLPRILFIAALTAAALSLAPAHAQTPAKKLFGAKTSAADMAARSFGTYTRGCLAGGKMLPVNGPAWQAMRLSRNRNWGHPVMVDLVERLAIESRAEDGWPGLLVGDLAQPRGGPMLTGHKSHQLGLDADIWLNPMPPRELTWEERETISAVSMLGADKLSINEELWTQGHVRLLKRAASYRQVARIFVHPVIKKALCDATGGKGNWLRKVRPWWGHHYHFHIRINCPGGSGGCANQNPPPGGTGCGKQLDDWFVMLRNAMKPKKKKAKPRKRRPLTMAQMPAACRQVLNAKGEPPREYTLAGGVPDARQRAVMGLTSIPIEGAPLPDRKPRKQGAANAPL
jgi:penicillin-insensitive murein endopeptidase